MVVQYGIGATASQSLASAIAGKGYRMPARIVWSFLGIVAVLFLHACAHLEDSSSNELVADFFGASTPEGLEVAINTLVDSPIDAEDLVPLLRAGMEYSADVPVGWTVYEITGLDNRTRPYHVYVPTTYDPEMAYTLLFDLHGAVSTVGQPAEYLMERRRLWEHEAEELGWILIVPHGDRNASWFSATGLANISSELHSVKRLYNVDENEVFLSGFSDGGSGAFWQAFHNATP